MSLLLRRPDLVSADTAALAAPVSVKALQYIEIDVDYCALRYGTTNAAGTCPARLGVDSLSKCFQSQKTCPVLASFTNTPATLRFAVPTAFLPDDIDCVPSIRSISFDPATISLGKDLGRRAALTITFDDHYDSDAGSAGDPYVTERGYDPFQRGTFFGKFRARQPYLFGRELRWINGVLGQDLADMEVRTFIINNFSGPDASGVFTIVAKDVLKYADGDKSTCPVANTGFLVADLTSVATSAVLSPAGIGSTEYAASGHVAIGGTEICAFTRSADTLTLTRGQLGTAAATHNAQDRVQTVKRYVSQDPAVIIADLLQNYSQVPASYIPLATWQAETAAYLNRLYTATIAQPTSVATLLSELLEQSGISLWDDNRNKVIGLRVLRGVVPDAQRFSFENMLADSLGISEQPDLRLSEVQVYFGQINALTSLTDKSNYRSVAITKDLAAETAYGSPAIREIYSRWIPALGRSVADRVGSILLGRFRDPPRHFKLQVLRHAVPEIILAGGYLLEAWPIQDATGNADSAPLQITRLKPMADVIEIEGDEVLFNAPAEDLTTRPITVDILSSNINLRAVHDLLYPAPAAGITVVCTINAGVIVGSTSTAAPAFDVGSWPAGVTIIIVVSGRCQGAGGKGGDALFGGGTPGLIGGPALYTRVAIKLAVAGELFGGGGGGGGSGDLAAGAGGGAGTIPGDGGGHTNLGGVSGNPGTADAGGLGGSFGGGHGGDGGAPGLPGADGTGSSPPPSLGAAAGAAIDGVSHVTLGTWSGSAFTPGATGSEDIRGSRIN